MATFNEVEDLRDWFIDAVAEMLAKIDVLDGDEPPDLLETAQKSVERMHQEGIEAIAALDAILVAKKRATP